MCLVPESLEVSAYSNERSTVSNAVKNSRTQRKTHRHTFNLGQMAIGIYWENIFNTAVKTRWLSEIHGMDREKLRQCVSSLLGKTKQTKTWVREFRCS